MSSESESANIELGASLLLTTTSCDSSKYSKKWRKSLYIGFLISLKKPTTSSDPYEESTSPFSSAPYTSLPPARSSSAKSFVSIDIVSHVQEEDGEEEERDGVVEQPVRDDIARIVKEKDLKSLLELGGVGRVCNVLQAQSQHSNEVS
jgi:hypothetical protein